MDSWVEPRALWRRAVVVVAGIPLFTSACTNDDPEWQSELRASGCELDADICEIFDALRNADSDFYVTGVPRINDYLVEDYVARLDQRDWTVFVDPDDDLFLDAPTPTPTPAEPDRSTVGPAPGPAAGYRGNSSM